MTEVVFKTWRAHRNLVERLRGLDKVYETEISDGERSARGRGETRKRKVMSSSMRMSMADRPLDPDRRHGYRS